MMLSAASHVKPGAAPSMRPDSERVALYSTPLYSKAPSIRLIRCISPAALIFHITSHELDSLDCPQYHALSYTWGAPFPIREDERLPRHVDELDDAGSTIYWTRAAHIIYLTDLEGNFWPRLVSPNLLDALRAVTQSSHYDHVPLWVDNICINQDSLRERNHQVGLMSQIYRRAESVVVWLGRDNQDLEQASLLLSSLDTSNRPAWVSLDGLTPAEGWDKGKDKKEEILIGLLKFYTRSWFYRRWTWQETTVAQRIAVLAGTITLSWEHIVQFAESFTNGGWVDQIRDGIDNRAAPTLAMQPRLFVESIKMNADQYAVNAKLLHGTCSYESIMLDVLSTGSSLHESVRNDRFFACLGVIEAIAALARAAGPPGSKLVKGPSIHQILQRPDYAISESKLFRRVMVACVTRLPDLSVLSRVRRLHVSDTSSWCSDPGLHGQSSAETNRMRVRWHTLYPARMSLPNRTVNRRGHLRLLGFRIGSILMRPCPLSVPDLAYDRTREFDFVEDLLDFLSDIESNRNHNLLGNMSSMETLAKLLVRDADVLVGTKRRFSSCASAALEGLCQYLRTLCCGVEWTKHEANLSVLFHSISKLNESWLDTWHGLATHTLSSYALYDRYDLRIWPMLKLQKDLHRGYLEHDSERRKHSRSKPATLPNRLEIFHLRDHNDPNGSDSSDSDSDSDSKDVNISTVRSRPLQQLSDETDTNISVAQPLAAGVVDLIASARTGQVCKEHRLSRSFRKAAKASRNSLLFATDGGLLGTTDDPSGVGKLPFGNASDVDIPDGASGSLEVWALDGGRAPFILRKLSGHEAEAEDDSLDDEFGVEGDWEATSRYVLVQECYIQGIMNGELRGRSELVPVTIV